MWLEKLKPTDDDGQILDPLFGDDGVQAKLLRVWEPLGLLLKKYHDLPIAQHELLAAVAILHNPYAATGAIWPEIAGNYGTARPAEAIKRLTEAKELLTRIRIHEARGGSADPTAREELGRMIQDASGLLWREVRRIIQFQDDDGIEQIVDHLIGYFDACLEERRNNSSKSPAAHIALALRVIFERFSTGRITAGYNNAAQTSGTFCRCLEEIYRLVGAKGNARYQTEKVRSLPEDDEHLCDLRSSFAVAVDRMREYREFLTQ